MLGKVAPKCLGLVLCAAAVTACSQDYSADTYASVAAQKANKVDQGVIVGVRPVQISADATLGTTTGAAAGGIAGSQVGSGNAVSALGALGGSVAGGVVGNAVAHAEGDTVGFEYIVRKPNGDLLSVTQTDTQPLGIGAHVLIIEGAQARVVADYTVPIEVEGLHPGDKPNAPQTAGAHPAGDAHAAGASTKPTTEASTITTAPLAPPAAAEADKKPADGAPAAPAAPAPATQSAAQAAAPAAAPPETPPKPPENAPAPSPATGS
jgi:outer membrane lipoprotein SlyB